MAIIEENEKIDPTSNYALEQQPLDPGACEK